MYEKTSNTPMSKCSCQIVLVTNVSVAKFISYMEGWIATDTYTVALHIHHGDEGRMGIVMRGGWGW